MSKEFKQYEIDPQGPRALEDFFRITDSALALGSAPFQSPQFVSQRTGWQLREDGSAEFQSINLRGRDLFVNTDESIQDAINVVSTSGGGVVRLGEGTYSLESVITLADNVRIEGSGLDKTILDFQETSGNIVATGTAADPVSNFGISGLTVTGSTTNGIDIDHGNNFIIENVRVTLCDDGFNISYSQYFIVLNCIADNNEFDGFDLTGSTAGAGRRIKGATLMNCISDDNADNGFELVNSSINTTGDFNDIKVFICSATTNGGDGFNVSGVGPLYLGECLALDNTGDGFGGGASGALFSGCEATSNDGRGFYITGASSRVFSCHANGNVGVDYETTASPQAIDLSGFAASTDMHSQVTLSENSPRRWSPRTSPRIEAATYYMKNSSGGNRVWGEVVVWAAATSGAEYTTTTTVGDDKVLGMVTSSVVDGSRGDLLTEGYTTALMVNGTTDIAVGDLLCTYSSAGISQKAAAGDMAFAIALEAYATNDSNGVIDAILIKPRKL